MDYISIDLGSTNIKVAVYNEEMQLTKWFSEPVNYIKENDVYEFDADLYVQNILQLIKRHVENKIISPESVSRITLTGQAESLIFLDANRHPIMNAISWMDERSVAEAAYIDSLFDSKTYYQKTGQLSVLPTWPATKALWLKNNKPELYNKTAHYVLLKDYVVYCLTGKLVCDSSIATFTSYFDIKEKEYWKEMCEVCGISPDQLPPISEPCSDIGGLTLDAAKACSLSTSTIVNIGTLDHFAGMIGVGNINMGTLSLSTGTVMGLSTMAATPLETSEKIALHYGFQKDTYIFLPVAESGGASLEWYKNNFLNDIGYNEMNETLSTRLLPNEVIFLPYLVGTNAPEYDADASGLFFGLRSRHDRLDLAYAIMEGVAFMLAKNVDNLRKSGVPVNEIIATGGGAKSAIWCQLQADATGVPVMIPRDKEAACLGAAIIGAVADGTYASYQDGVDKVVVIEHIYSPRDIAELKIKRKKFDALYKCMVEISKIKE